MKCDNVYANEEKNPEVVIKINDMFACVDARTDGLSWACVAIFNLNHEITQLYRFVLFVLPADICD